MRGLRLARFLNVHSVRESVFRPEVGNVLRDERTMWAKNKQTRTGWVVGLTLISAALTGCFRPTGPGNGQASFYLVQLGSQANNTMIPGPMRSDWSDIPTAQIFFLRACVNEVPRNAPVQNHTFHVFDGDKKIATAKTDPSGCLNWQETIPYNIVARPTYLTLERQMEADGIHQGRIPVTLAVNPWSGRTGADRPRPVVDITLTQKPESLPFLKNAQESRKYMATDSMEGVGQVDMVISSVGFRFHVERQTDEKVPTEFTFRNLGLRTQTMEGAPTDITVRQGSFKFEPIFVMHRDATQPGAFAFSLNNAVEPNKHTVRFNGDQAVDQNVPVRLNLQSLGQFNGEFQLFLQVEPSGDAPAGVRATPIVFQIGTRGNLLRGEATVTQESNNAFGQVAMANLRERMQTYRLAESRQGTQVSAPILVDSIGGAPLQVQQRDDSPSQNHITYALSAPVRVALSGGSWGGRRIRVEPVDPQDQVSCQGQSNPAGSAVCEATPSGTLMWQHRIQNRVFRLERWLEKRVRFVDVTTGLAVESCFFVQMVASGAGQVRNCETGLPQNMIVASANRRPFIRTTSVSWRRLQLADLKVDPSLDLDIAWDTSFSVAGGMVRPDSLNGGLSAPPQGFVVNQLYGVTLMLLRHDPVLDRAAREILMSVRRVVRYEGGGTLTFTAPVAIQHWAALQMSAVNFLMVEVVPIRHEALPPALLRVDAGQMDHDLAFKPDVFGEDGADSDVRAMAFVIPADMSGASGSGDGIALDNTHLRSLITLNNCAADDSRPECAPRNPPVIVDSAQAQREASRAARSPGLLEIRDRFDSKPLYRHAQDFEAREARLRRGQGSNGVPRSSESPGFRPEPLDAPALVSVYKQDHGVNLQLLQLPGGDLPGADEFSVPGLSPQDMIATLSCMDQNSWSPEADLGHYRARCMVGDSREAVEMRRRVLHISNLLRGFPSLGLASVDQLVEQCRANATRVVEEAIANMTGRAAGLSSTDRENMRREAHAQCSRSAVEERALLNLAVDERTFVYDLERTVPRGEVRSWFSSWAVGTDLALVNFDATDRGNMRMSGVDAGVSGSPLGRLISAGAAWSHNAYVIDFTRDAYANSAALSTGTTLLNEQMQVPLVLKDYRTCFIITRRQQVDGVMVCAPRMQNQNRRVVENYYMTYTAPPQATLLVDPNNRRNRWLLTYRGERDQARFMTALSCAMTPFHQNNNPASPSEIFWRGTALVAERWRSERGVLSSASVGMEQFVRAAGTQRRYFPLHPFENFGFRNFVDMNAGRAQSFTRDRCWTESSGAAAPRQ